MDFIIRIGMENAAFADGNEGEELAREALEELRSARDVLASATAAYERG